MRKILVIEDNPEVRENIAEILQLSNYDVITANDGKTGVEIALKEIPDLIVCDIMMPVLDGYGALNILGKHDETAGIPFIFLTAKSEKSDFRKGMGMGADDYITKPFEGIELLDAVESRLKKTERIRQQFNPDKQGVDQFIHNAQELAHLNLTSGERELAGFSKKQIIYREGQHPRYVYFIVSGKVKTYMINENGKELITHIYGENDFLGYLTVLEEHNYKDNAEVLEDSEIMLIPREDFMNLVLNDIRISRQFIKLIAHKSASDAENLLNLAYSSLRKKVAFGLTRLSEKYKKDNDPNIVLHLSRENMANTIGIATESLIRTLSDFKEEKLIDIRNGKVVVLNEEKLKSIPY